MAEEPQLLKQSTIGLGGAIIVGVSYMAPIMCLIFTTAAMVDYAGAPAPLIYIAATIGVLCTGNALAQFSRRFPSAGSSVTYLSKSFDGRVGFVAAILLLCGMVVVACTVNAIIGSWTSGVIEEATGVVIPWQYLTVVFSVIFTAVAMRGLNISTKTATILFLAQCLVLAVIAVAVVAKGGAEGLSAAPFSFRHLTSASGFGWAFILAVYSYIGYEAIVTLGEETRNPRRNTPLAVFSAIVILGAIYVVLTYVAVIGAGVNHLERITDNPNFFGWLTDKYVGGGSLVFGIAGIVSISGCLLSILNTIPRIFYSVARAGLFPSFIGRVHPRWRTPYMSVLVYGSLLCLLPLFASLLGMDSALTIFAVFGVWGGVPVTIMYTGINVALITFWLRNNREGNIVTHLFIPILGIAVWIMPLYLNLKPADSGYFKWTWLITVVPIIVGVALLPVITKRRDPAALARVFAGEAGDEELESAAATGVSAIGAAAE